MSRYFKIMKADDQSIGSLEAYIKVPYYDEHSHLGCYNKRHWKYPGHGDYLQAYYRYDEVYEDEYLTIQLISRWRDKEEPIYISGRPGFEDLLRKGIVVEVQDIDVIKRDIVLLEWIAYLSEELARLEYELSDIVYQIYHTSNPEEFTEEMIEEWEKRVSGTRNELMDAERKEHEIALSIILS
ncbi:MULTISPECIES: hypothetical protein [Desulfitobacterium]|uniref:Uncharacterized protein n=1 Tax=Desulfitobacterium chlororespirans DSM 11544 TaxID=1121395 RepID=A0A1M7UU14_9FIRM|nr:MULTISPECIES: hypothetical protein [Desulfitobacterium]SHN86459.1 hypothetical protein SAMN02745215_04635 [Desulfitobacterium chlororespirans DSM 11544]